MKKSGVFLSILLLGISLFPRDNIKLGAYVGYFSAAGATLKQIYKGEDAIYGVKLGIRIWDEFYLWISGKQFKRTSETTLLGDLTTLTLQPVNLSLRYTFSLGSVNPYLEGGYSYVLFKEKSPIGDVNGEGKGYSLDVGIEFKLSSWFIIDLGAQYNRATVRPTGFDIQLGGAQAGVALLLVF